MDFSVWVINSQAHAKKICFRFPTNVTQVLPWCRMFSDASSGSTASTPSVY